MDEINPTSRSIYRRRRLTLLALLLMGLLLSVAIVVSKNRHLPEGNRQAKPAEPAGSVNITTEDRAQAREEFDAREDQSRAAAASPLHWAIQRDDHVAFTSALDDVDNLRAHDQSGNTALHEAVLHQRLAYSVALLLIGADPHAQNADGKTPYYLLVSRKVGANIFDRYGRLLDHTFTGVPPGQRNNQAAFVVAVEYDDVNLLARVIDQGAMVDEPWSPDGDAGLHHVQSAAAADLLISAGANVNTQDRSGATPVMIAVTASDGRLIERLIHAGADVNLRDNRHFSALTLAIRDSRLPAMSVLLTNDSEVGLDEWLVAVASKNSRALGVLFKHGATFSVSSPEGEEILRRAQMHGSLQVAEALDAHPTIGPELRKRTERQSQENSEDLARIAKIIAPHLVVFFFVLSVVPLLFGLMIRSVTSSSLFIWSGTLIASMLTTYLAFFPLDIQVWVAAARWAGAPLEGFLPLAQAIALALSAIIALLVLILLAALGRPTSTASTRRSRLFLAMSVSAFLVLALHHFERIEFLDRGYFAIVGDPEEAVANSGLFKPPIKRQPTPVATDPGDVWFDHIDHERFLEIQSALSSGSDPNLKRRWGSTALHLAVSKRNLPLIELLLEYHADTELRDKQGNTALTIAVNNSSPKTFIEIVSLLLSAGADANAAGFKQVLPLCRLMERERENSDHAAVTEVANLLLDAGALINHDGCAPLHYTHVPDRVKWLLDKGAELEAKAALQRPGRSDYGKVTPLWNAVYRSDIPLTEAFLMAGADVNAQDSVTGQTPLYLALARIRYQSTPKPQNLAMIELLLANGADTGIVAYDGTTIQAIDAHQITRRTSN